LIKSEERVLESIKQTEYINDEVVLFKCVNHQTTCLDEYLPHVSLDVLNRVKCVMEIYKPKEKDNKGSLKVRKEIRRRKLGFLVDKQNK
jgi:hypothetical protein